MHNIIDLLEFKTEKEKKEKLEVIQKSIASINEMYNLLVGVDKLFIPLSEGIEEYVFTGKKQNFTEWRYLISNKEGDYALALYILLTKHLFEINSSDDYTDDYSSIVPIFISLLEALKDEEDKDDYQAIALMDFKEAIYLCREKMKKYLAKGSELTFSNLPGTKTFIIAIAGKGAKIEHSSSTSFDFVCLQFDDELPNYPKVES